jgi:creatinine amidohydrolase/Fe(II)-dependent formamide hydrolase-like protein
MVRRTIALAAVLLGTQGAQLDPVRPDPNGPRPIAARETVFMEDMTWMEVRDAMKAGKTTAIVATGGLEQNGPYLAAGKHNIVLRATTEAIARKLGDALVATIVPYVPEGDIALLTDICSCLRTHGFKEVVLIGDSGGNQDGMKAVADALNAKWSDGKTRFRFVKEYYDYPEVARWLESQGVKQTDEGLHDDFAITSIMMTVDTNSVRFNERVAAGKAKINGVDLVPAEKAIAWGKKVVEHRAEITAQAIREARRAAR